MILIFSLMLVLLPAPTITTADCVNGKISVAWNPVSNAPFYAIRIDYRDNDTFVHGFNGEWQETDLTVMQFYNVGVGGGRYSVRVNAVDAVGVAGKAASVRFTCP